MSSSQFRGDAGFPGIKDDFQMDSVAFPLVTISLFSSSVGELTSMCGTPWLTWQSTGGESQRPSSSPLESLQDVLPKSRAVDIGIPK